jgi:hypothetical protein
LPDCAIIHQPAGHFVAVIREPQTKQWYVIDPMKWDHQHDVPCCMPMNNSRVRDKYTGTIYLFTNLRSASKARRLHEPTGLLDAKSILERNSAVVAFNTDPYGSPTHYHLHRLWLAPSPPHNIRNPTSGVPQTSHSHLPRLRRTLSGPGLRSVHTR